MCNENTLKGLVKKATSYRSLAKLLGDVSHTTAKSLVLKFGLDTEHFKFGKKYQNTVGAVCNHLTILRVWREGSGKSLRWFCDCSCSCGKLTTRKRLDNVLKGRVISCGCSNLSKPTILAGGNGYFKGCGELRGSKLVQLKRGAQRRGLEFSVSKEYLWELFQEQGGKCALTGASICFGRVYYPHETTASLDRIDSSRGYVEGNLQWVLKDVNKIKKDLDQDYFIALCRMVSDHSRDHRQRLESLPLS